MHCIQHIFSLAPQASPCSLRHSALSASAGAGGTRAATSLWRKNSSKDPPWDETAPLAGITILATTTRFGVAILTACGAAVTPGNPSQLVKPAPTMMRTESSGCSTDIEPCGPKRAESLVGVIASSKPRSVCMCTEGLEWISDAWFAL